MAGEYTADGVPVVDIKQLFKSNEVIRGFLSTLRGEVDDIVRDRDKLYFLFATQVNPFDSRLEEGIEFKNGAFLTYNLLWEQDLYNMIRTVGDSVFKGEKNPRTRNLPRITQSNLDSFYEATMKNGAERYDAMSEVVRKENPDIYVPVGLMVAERGGKRPIEYALGAFFGYELIRRQCATKLLEDQVQP